MPNWKYKVPKVFPIDKLPERGYWLMKHTHNVAMLTRMAEKGIAVPVQAQPIKLEVRYGDEKDLHEHGQVEKEYKCAVCGEVETYIFKLRKAGERREAMIQEAVIDERTNRN